MVSTVPASPSPTTTALVEQLMAHIQGDVLASDLDRAIYSTDASMYRVLPRCVVAPRDTADIVQTLQLVHAHHSSIIPRGGGTSLSGQSVGTGVVLDLSKYMNRVLELNATKRWVWVEAGAIQAHVNNMASQHGLKIGPDPSSTRMASVGGMIGNNSTGAHSILYGMIADHVKAVEVVLWDGSVVMFDPKTPDELEQITQHDTLEARLYREIPSLVRTYAEDIRTRYPKVWRNVAGYNLDRVLKLMERGESFTLAPLIVGSEGTLGVVTRVKLNLVDIPKHTHLSVVHFNSLRESMEAVPTILEHQPAAVELIDRYFNQLAATSTEWGALLPHYFRNDPAAVLVVEFYGNSMTELSERAQQLQAHLAQKGYRGEVVQLAQPHEINTLWNIRKAGLGLMMSKRGDAKPQSFIDDATVPIEHLPAFAEEVERICNELGTPAAIIGHASAGCIHVNPTLSTKDPASTEKIRQLSEAILTLAIKYEGSTTGEHGEGIARSFFNEQLYGTRLHTAFRQVKGLFDPHNLLNPGKIIDAPTPWDPQVIRMSPHYHTQHAPTFTWLDFSQDGGFSGAVEMCNGQGFCRKTDGGIMCPSYIATRDEKHSTRGRANALRSAMSGALGEEGMTSDALYEALDLCLECKACQRECPSIVDMAKMKSEFLAHYQAAKGVPLRSRVFGNIRLINQLGSLPVVRSLVNWSFTDRTLRAWMELGLGIAQARSLPLLARQPFGDWFKQHAQPTAPTANKVILWDDTFMTYNEPQVGIAAVRLLEALDYTVEVLSNHACCGRPMISKGLLEQAKHAAEHNLARLRPALQAHTPIIGLEPSCVSAFRDEYPDLLRTDEARQLGQQVLFFEEFFVQALAKHPLRFATPTQPREIHVHGHCHQRTLIGAETMVAMLRHLPNTTVKLIDSGCCGMAGSFGYEAEHHELSLKIGEDRLFPAIRATHADALISAPGTSCRHQIYDATGRVAVHPLVLMADALA